MQPQNIKPKTHSLQVYISQPFLKLFLALAGLISSCSTPDENYYFEKGKEELKQGKYLEALLDYNKVLELNPDHIPALNSRAVLEEFMGDTVGSLRDLKHILLLDSNHTNASFMLANYYLDKENYPLSYKMYKRCRDLNYYLGVAYRGMGVSLFHLGQEREAIIYLDSAIQMTPGEPDFYWERGYFKFLRSDTLGACADFEILLRLDTAQRFNREKVAAFCE